MVNREDGPIELLLNLVSSTMVSFGLSLINADEK